MGVGGPKIPEPSQMVAFWANCGEIQPNYW